MHPDDLPVEAIDRAVESYVECALWSSMDQSDPETGGEPMDAHYDSGDIASDTYGQMVEDVRYFLAENWSDVEIVVEGLPCTYDSIGHDFWLTRNGHGAGFWDRTFEDGPVREALLRLTKACQYTEYTLYIGDDDQIYGEG